MYRAVAFSDHADNNGGWLIDGPGGLHGRLTNGTIGVGGITMSRREAEEGAREMHNREHLKSMNLRIGKTGAVVTDNPIISGVPGTDDVDSYGGYLFCETITKANAEELVKRWNAFKHIESLLSNTHIDLGDLVYKVRESEGLGWEGLSVKSWSDAVTGLKEIFKGAKRVQ